MDIDDQIVFLAAKLCWPEKNEATIFSLLTVHESGKNELLWKLQGKINAQQLALEIEKEGS